MSYVDTKYFWMGALFGVVLVLLLPQLARAVVNTNLPSLPLSQVARSWTDLHSLDEDGDGLIDVNSVKQGPGSGFDADTVDGYHASDLLAAASGPDFVNFDENGWYLFGVSSGHTNISVRGPVLGKTLPLNGDSSSTGGLMGIKRPADIDGAVVVGTSVVAGSPYTFSCDGNLEGNFICSVSYRTYYAFYIGRVLSYFQKQREFNIEYNFYAEIPTSGASYSVNILEFCGDAPPVAILAQPYVFRGGCFGSVLSNVYVGRVVVQQGLGSYVNATGVVSYTPVCSHGYIVIALFGSGSLSASNITGRITGRIVP